MSELDLGTVLLHKYRIDGLRVASRDVHVYDATDTLHDRHVSIKVFERACRSASEEHEGPVIDMGVVEGGAMYVVETDSPVHRKSPPPLPRKPVAKAKSEPRARPIAFGRLNLARPSKPPPVPSPPLPKVIVEEDIDVEIDVEEDVDDEPTIDRRRAELDIEIPIDFAKAVRASSNRRWWLAGIAAAAVIAAGVAWGARRAPANSAPIETKTIAPDVTPAKPVEPAIVAPPPQPTTTDAPPASTSEHRHHHRAPGEDPLTI